MEFTELSAEARIAAIKIRIRDVEADVYDHLLARLETEASRPWLRPGEYDRLTSERRRELAMCRARLAALRETLDQLL